MNRQQSNMNKFTWDIYTLVIFLYNKHKENKMTIKQIKTFKVIHFSMKVFILQHNCIKRTTTKCPKGEGKSDIGSYFLIMEINTSLIQFSSVAQSRLTLCDPVDSSMPSLPVHHQLLDLLFRTRIPQKKWRHPHSQPKMSKIQYLHAVSKTTA